MRGLILLLAILVSESAFAEIPNDALVCVGYSLARDGEVKYRYSCDGKDTEYFASSSREPDEFLPADSRFIKQFVKRGYKLTATTGGSKEITYIFVRQ